RQGLDLSADGADRDHRPDRLSLRRLVRRGAGQRRLWDYARFGRAAPDRRRLEDRAVRPQLRRAERPGARRRRRHQGRLMEVQDDAFVLSARAHGDTGAVVDLLTERHGRRAAYVAGGASRKMRPFLQPGARVVADLRSRTSDQLGSARLEPVGEGPAALFDDPLALTGLSAAAAVAQGALPEREPHPGAFYAFEALM